MQRFLQQHALGQFLSKHPGRLSCLNGLACTQPTSSAYPPGHIVLHPPSSPSSSSTSISTSAGPSLAHSQAAPSIDEKEAKKFSALASQWWDPAGPFAPLHRLNFARCKFIRDAACAMLGLEHMHGEPLAGLRVLDVGCGGGILSESMARMGAQVQGIDITEENVQVAQRHAAQDPLVRSRTRYACIPLEELAGTQGHSDSAEEESTQPHQDQHHQPQPQQQYNLVLASEVIEHVKRPDQFFKALAAVAAPGSSVFVSTLNRTPASFALGIVAAEYIACVVPRGTHQWDRFITPEELAIMASDAGLTLAHLVGIQLSPAAPGSFVLTDDTSVNYIAAFYRP